MLEDFDVVIPESQASAPHGGQKQELDVDIAQVTEQQHCRQQRDKDDNTAHGRGSLLCHLAFQTEVPDGFANLFLLKPFYHLLAEEEGDQHGQHIGGNGPEGQVVHQALSGYVKIFQFFENIVQHISLSSKGSFPFSVIW